MLQAMRYRIATPADTDALAALRWEFFREEHAELPREARSEFVARFRDFLSDALGSGRWTIWIAERGNEIVGNAWLYAVPKVPRPDRESRPIGYVTNVYVVPGVRDQGIGTKLLDALHGWARTAAFEELFVWPSERSRDFYARAGFTASLEIMERDVLGYQE